MIWEILIKYFSSALVSPSRRCRRSSFQLLFIFNPIVSICIWRINKFGNDFIVCFYNQYGTCILMLPAIISGWKYSDKWATCKSFKSIHDTLMCTNNHTEIVLFQKLLYSIRAKFYNISSLWGISQMIWNDTQLTVWLSWVWPENIENDLRLFVLNLVHDLQRPFDVFDVS